jgi:hypothetical protein
MKSKNMIGKYVVANSLSDRTPLPVSYGYESVLFKGEGARPPYALFLALAIIIEYETVAPPLWAEACDHPSLEGLLKQLLMHFTGFNVRFSV